MGDSFQNMSTASQNVLQTEEATASQCRSARISPPLVHPNLFCTRTRQQWKLNTVNKLWRRVIPFQNAASGKGLKRSRKTGSIKMHPADLYFPFLFSSMPPHCDTLDGPVIQAAKKAINDVNVLHVLPWVPAEAEQEVRDAFEDVMHAREKGPDPCKIADRWFFETVVRLHLLGEGKPFTGLKPAGSGRSPALTIAEKAIETGDLKELIELLKESEEFGLERYFDRVKAMAGYDLRDVSAARKHVQAVLDFLHLADSMYHIAIGTEHEQEEAIKKAEAAVKGRLGLPYRQRHHATVEGVTHHHS